MLEFLESLINRRARKGMNGDKNSNFFHGSMGSRKDELELFKNHYEQHTDTVLISIRMKLRRCLWDIPRGDYFS